MTDQSALRRASGTQPPVFRPVQYLGNKMRLLEAIAATVDGLDPGRGRVLDLFSGSGVVSARLASEREVIAVDVQEYARVLASALLGCSRQGPDAARAASRAARLQANAWAAGPFSRLVALEHDAHLAAESGDFRLLASIVEHGSLAAFQPGVVTPDPDLRAALAETSDELRSSSGLSIARNYGGVYFSYRQALQLDGLLLAARMAPRESRDAALAAILSTASEAVATVGGHFAQPVRPKTRAGLPKTAALRGLASRRALDLMVPFVQWADRYSRMRPPAGVNQALRADYREVLASTLDKLGVVYADPPYTRDHYSRFYHVLETIALDDEPTLSVASMGGSRRITRGLYREDRHQSPFCIRSQVRPAFAELFAGVRKLGVPLILSYSPLSPGTRARPETRLIDVEEIRAMAAGQFRRVEVVAAGGVVHSKFNAAHLNAERALQAEVLIACSP